ncbi:MAG TPA: type II secretion system F family protein [Streptosporangiaceae bacterium]
MTSRKASRWGGAVAVLAAWSLLALPASVAAAQSAAAAHAPAPSSPVVLVLLDSHQSWPGKGIPEKRKVAALRYVSALPGDVRVGLITFDANWKLLLSPTTDRSHLGKVLRSAQGIAGNSTGIYAAITGAESLLRHLGAASGRLVILSNAEEVISRPSFKPAVPIDIVPWRYDSDDNLVELQALAAASRGRVADPIHAPSLAGVLPHAAPPAPAPSRRATAPVSRGAGPSWLLIGGLVCVFLALLLIAMRVLRPLARGDPRRLADQIDRYGPQHAPSQPETEGKTARTVLGWASSLLRSTNTERGLAERLDWAGITRSPSEWVLLTGCGCVVLAGALTVLTHNALLGIPVGMLVGWLAMHLYVSFKIGRRRTAFGEQLPDVLQLIAGSLQSGFSLPQSLDAVVRENTQPAAAEFSRALAEARIGADLEDALQRIGDRMDSTDLRWTVMAIRIQREVGGNLAEVLLTTVGTMRERAFLRRQVRALSSEGRLSAYILIALPILIGGWFFYSDPKYMSLLYTTVPGLIMFVGSTVLVVLGALWMRKLINIEV